MITRKIMALVILTVLIVCWLPYPVNADISWWDNSWGYRQSVLINGSGTSVGANYPISIVVKYGVGTSSGNTVYLNNHSNVDFSDIRFISNDNATVYPYWNATFYEGDNATFWVAPSEDLTDSEIRMWIYYGNPSATSLSNGSAVFDYFQDFSGTDLPTGWIKTGTCNYAVSDGVLTVSRSGSNTGGMVLYNTNTWGQNHSVLARLKMEGAAGSGYMWAETGFMSNNGGSSNPTDEASVGTIYQTFTTNYVARASSGGTGGDSAMSGYPYNVWHTFDVRWTSNLTIYVDGNYGGGRTTNIPSGSLYLANFVQSNGGAITLDWAAVRNYYTSEPVLSGWTEEDSPFPTISDIGYSTSDPGASCTFSAYLSDDVGLASYIFSFDNGSGVFVNDSSVSVTGTSAWANVTKSLSLRPAVVKWKYYVYDADGYCALSSEQTLTINPFNLTLNSYSFGGSTWGNIRPVKLDNGSRYITSTSGSGTAIQIWAANEDWTLNSSVSNSSYTVTLFYVKYIPEIWPDTLIIFGGSPSFVALYNFTSDTWSSKYTWSAYSYIDDVLYSNYSNKFYIVGYSDPADATAAGIGVVSPEDFTNTSSYSLSIYPSNAKGFGRAVLFNDSIYILHGYTGSKFGYQLLKMDLSNNTYAIIEEDTDTSTITTAAGIFTSLNTNGTTMAFAIYVKNGTSWYWTTKYSNDGVTWTPFLNFSYVGNPSVSEERSASITPWHDVFIVTNTQDGDSSSYLRIYDAAGNMIYSYDGILDHYTWGNVYVDDTVNNYSSLVMYGEGGVGGNYAKIKILSDLTYSSEDEGTGEEETGDDGGGGGGGGGGGVWTPPVIPPNTNTSSWNLYGIWDTFMEWLSSIPLPSATNTNWPNMPDIPSAISDTVKTPTGVAIIGLPILIIILLLIGSGALQPRQKRKRNTRGKKRRRR